MFLRTVIAVALLSAFGACAKSSGGGKSATPAAATTSTSTAASLSTNGKTIVTGTLVIEDETTGEHKVAAEAVVYLEGHGDTPAKTTSAGTFAVEVPADGASLADGGTKTVTWGASFKRPNGTWLGVKQEDVQIRLNSENALGDVVLLKAGTITGTVGPGGGATVVLPGSPFKTTANEGGLFTLEGVPPGHWIVEASKPGFAKGQSAEVPVASRQTLVLPEPIMLEAQ